MILNKVTINLDILGVIMKNIILNNIDDILIITMHIHGILPLKANLADDITCIPADIPILRLK